MNIHYFQKSNNHFSDYFFIDTTQIVQGFCYMLLELNERIPTKLILLQFHASSFHSTIYLIHHLI